MTSPNRIPRTMSTQHPDNVTIPFFATSQNMSGEDEIQEAYYAFSHLQCQEQMWDCEGKEVDDFVVRKLLTQYQHYINQNRLGRDIFLTLRVPNPNVEKAEGKVLLETLETIPRSFDAAQLVHGDNTVPIFEVILPMTTSHESLNRVYHLYRDFIVGSADTPISPGDISIAQWVGEFMPKEINVIPLFEDYQHTLTAADILQKYLADKCISRQRVFLARSDPALNYGMVAAVLLVKVALQRLAALEKKTEVEILPILGAGSAPFRGHLKPNNVEQVLNEYPSTQTFTIQSAFKYDNPVDEVISAIKKINVCQPSNPTPIDEEYCIKVIDSVAQAYQRKIHYVAPLVNYVASSIPPRRKRRLHIGLFGYTRQTEDGISLPRAIGFCAACYSLGFPPEFLGLDGLSRATRNELRTFYHSLENDLQAAAPYINEEVFSLIPELKQVVPPEYLAGSKHTEHHNITSRIIAAVKEEDRDNLPQLILEAAHLRGFLG